MADVGLLVCVISSVSLVDKGAGLLTSGFDFSLWLYIVEIISDIDQNLSYPVDIVLIWGTFDRPGEFL